MLLVNADARARASLERCLGDDGAELRRAKDDNRWQLPVRDSLCWPYAIARRDGIAVISDSGNNRVVVAALVDGNRQ